MTDRPLPGGRPVPGDHPLPGLDVLEEGTAFLALAGLRFTSVAPDRVEGTIELGPQHHTRSGSRHGGVYPAAGEPAASGGATIAADARGLIAVGVHNSTDFVRSMTAGV